MTGIRLAVAAFVACMVASCASGGTHSGGADIKALEQLYRARTDSALTRFSEADVRFVTAMIQHHGQAIEMAELAPARTDDSSIRTLAARIINAQRDEIDIMERWLRDRGQSLPPGDAHGDHMPGMLSATEIEELRESMGRAFDRLFLTSMIRHHQGALAMVEELLAAESAVQHPATFELASDIHVDQATEIARMERMLATLTDAAADSARGGGR